MVPQIEDGRFAPMLRTGCGDQRIDTTQSDAAIASPHEESLRFDVG